MVARLVERNVHLALARLWPDANLAAVRVETAREKEHGDLAINAALVLAKQLRRKPLDIAAEIAAAIGSDPLFVAVETAPPGFVNCRIAPAAWREMLAHILQEGDRFGAAHERTGRKEQIEFVSANPTGPLNVVSARAAAVGDTLGRLLEATGIEVEREFYVNDFGSQVDHLTDSVIYFLEGEKGEFPENGYHGAYVADLAADVAANLAPIFRPVGEAKDEPESDALEAWVGEAAGGRGSDPARNAKPLPGGQENPVAVSHGTWRVLIRRWVLEKVLKRQREDLASFGVSFDSWYRESKLHREGKVDDTLAELDRAGDVYEEEGATWFRSSRYGDDEDRVIRRSNGRPSYFLADIAYHREKALRGFDHAIDVLGPDHHGHIARMVAAMEALGREKGWLEGFIVQQVNLMRGGEQVKMSKRAGEFVTLRDLVDEVGVDAARFFFLMLRPNTHLNFDMELATKKSLDNPVYYVQYAHARVCSVFRHAEAAGIEQGGAPGACLDPLESPEDIELLRALDPFPDVVASAAKQREPQRLAAYLKDLASTFHTYYHKVKVVTPEKEVTVARLALLEGVRTVLRNGLRLLGVSAPDSM